jgi:hypothetical protein
MTTVEPPPADPVPPSPRPPSAATAGVRPLGVTVIAILAGLGGVLGLLAALTLLSVIGLVGGLGTFFFLLALVVAIVSLVFAYGAWTLQPWAWTMGIVLEALAVVNALYAIADGDSSGVISLLIAGVILWYLFQPDVKAAFGRT